MEGWAEGTHTTESMDGTIQLNSMAIGQGRLLKDLIELDYEEFVQELADE